MESRKSCQIVDGHRERAEAAGFAVDQFCLPEGIHILYLRAHGCDQDALGIQTEQIEDILTADLSAGQSAGSVLAKDPVALIVHQIHPAGVGPRVGAVSVRVPLSLLSCLYVEMNIGSDSVPDMECMCSSEEVFS